jgi:hypothetical protein
VFLQRLLVISHLMFLSRSNEFRDISRANSLSMCLILDIQAKSLLEILCGP